MSNKPNTSLDGYSDGDRMRNVNFAVTVPAPAEKSLHIAEIIPRPELFNAWEHRRPTILQEIAGEFFGVFIHVYSGISSTAVFNIGGLIGNPQLGSILQLAFGYAFGIAFAIIVCGMSSGGHFNPAVTLASATYRGFPWRKVPYFWAAQICGSLAASMVVYGSYRETILAIDATLIAAGKGATRFTGPGTAGIFAFYAPVGTPLQWVFFNEFFADFFIGMLLWGILDPSNIFVTPTSIAPLVGLAYFIPIAGMAPNGLSANPSRDLGSRIAVMILWGKEASGGHYAAIAALTPLIATVIAAGVYEFLLYDSSRVVTRGARDVISNSEHQRVHKETTYTMRVSQNRANAASTESLGKGLPTLAA